ncbi:DUF4190 domain-containing protein [Kribbella sp. NPDC055071]
MTQPPYGPDPGRPQDRPQDATQPFPTYGRPQLPPAGQPQAGQPQAGQPGQAQGGTQWAAPGQPPPQQQGAYGQQAPYGQQPGGYQQAGYQQAGPQPAGAQQAGAQSAYGQQAYGQPSYPAPMPYAYGYGYAGQQGGGTNGLAAASLACGLGGLIIGISAPVAIPLGIAALVQIKKRNQTGKGMAIAGLIIGSVLTVGYVLLLVFLFALGSSLDDDYNGASGTSSSTTTYEDLSVGECFDDGSADDEAIRRTCTEAHDGEIISQVTLGDGPYPGKTAVNTQAKSACATVFAAYVGKSVDKSELDVAWWTPDENLWNDHDRMVICAAYGPPGEDLTSTVKNSHR